MTPKEKARELVSKFIFLSYPESNSKFYNPKQCALIAVDEIMNELVYDKQFEYWQQVKTEIEKL